MGRIPFREVIGAEVIEAGHGRSTVRMPASEHTQNNLGMAHGGALCTLADAALGTALRSALKPGDAVATIEMKMNFIAPGRGDLLAHAAGLARRGHHRSGRGGDRGLERKAGRQGPRNFLREARGCGAAPGARTAMIPEVDGPEPQP